MHYENITQKVVFSNAILALLTFWRKYDVIPQNDSVQEKATETPTII
jgi:hypothetical protein